MNLFIQLKASIHNLKRGCEHVLVLLENEKGEILMAGKPQYPKGMFRLPGGGVNKGEKIEDAAAREVMEELGVVAKDVKVIERFEIVGISDGKDYPLIQYITHANLGNQQIKIDNDELSSYVWVDKNGLEKAIKVFESFEDEFWQGYGKIYGPVHKIALEAYNRRSWTLLE